MNTARYLEILQQRIHSAAFATLGADGLPEVRIIDVMLADAQSIYFLTAKGKAFYRQLIEQGFVALSGTRDKVSISLRGKIRNADPALLDEVFRRNPYMADIYPGNTRAALEVFQLYEGQGEYFDLNATPVFRDSFALGGAAQREGGFCITDRCIGCGSCQTVCPQRCIDAATPYAIRQEHCLHCGRCAEICPAAAVVRREESA